MAIKTTALEEMDQLDKLDKLDELINEVCCQIIDDIEKQERDGIGSLLDGYEEFNTWLMSGCSLSDKKEYSGPLEAETINGISIEKYESGRRAWLAARKARACWALSVVHPERFMDEEAGYEKEAIRQYVSEMVEDLSNTTICYVLKKLLK